MRRFTFYCRNFRNLLLLTLIYGLFLTACSRELVAYDTITSCKKPQEGSVTVTWFGAASVLVSDGKSRVLIDPFVSREDMSFTSLRLLRPLVPSRRIVASWSRKIGWPRNTKKLPAGAANEKNAIIVSHSHYDHSIDAAAFAEYSKAPVYGSPSTQRIVRAHGYDDVRDMPRKCRLPTKDSIGKRQESETDENCGRSQERSRYQGKQDVKPEKLLEIGDFSTIALPAEHGPVILGKVPFKGKVREDFSYPATLREYRLGLVDAILVKRESIWFLHLGSAGVHTDMLEALHTEEPREVPLVVLLTLTGREDTGELLKETLGKTRANAVIPIHFDNLFLPVDMPMEVLGLAEFEEFVEVLRRDHNKVEFMPLPLGKACAVLPLERTRVQHATS